VSNVKELFRRALASAGLDVRRRRHVPFGVRWEDDLSYYLRLRAMRSAFDVGAHRGETALRLLRAFPGVQVHSFEPLPENFAALEEATAGSGARTVNAAVSDTSGTVRIARGRSTQHASLHGEGEGVDVPALTIDEYMYEHGIDRVDLLKIDTEGHEEAVLRGSLRHLEDSRIDFVLCECEFTARADEPHGDFRAILGLLEPLDYRVVSIYTNGVDNVGWLWGDVLFRHAPGPANPRSWVTSPYVQRDSSGLC
jgi:FkbM family methyltransferase